MGSKHGHKSTSLFGPDPLYLLQRPLRSVGEVCELLEETINRVRLGSLDLRSANTLGFLSGIHLKALNQRVDAPESTNREASPGMYMSLFERLGSAERQQEVFELYPQRRTTDARVAPEPLPTPSESKHNPLTTADPEGIITVEVG
jgi:hypothetical protein